MKCPNCNAEMKNDYCMRCGYMLNGNFIDTKKPIEDSLMEVYLGKDYDKIIRNQNWFVAGLLGPVYIFCRGFYLEGLLLIIFDYFISFLFMILNHAFLFHYIVILFNIFYLILNRFIWSAVTNLIYKILLSKRLLQLEKKYSKDKKTLSMMYLNSKKLFVLKYILCGILFLLLFLYLRSLIYKTFQFV